MVLELEASPVAFDLVREIVEDIIRPLLPMSSAVSVNSQVFGAVLDEADPETVKLTIRHVFNKIDMERYAIILGPLEKAANNLLAAGTPQQAKKADHDVPLVQKRASIETHRVFKTVGRGYLTGR